MPDISIFRLGSQRPMYGNVVPTFTEALREWVSETHVWKARSNVYLQRCEYL